MMCALKNEEMTAQNKGGVVADKDPAKRAMERLREEERNNLYDLSQNSDVTKLARNAKENGPGGSAVSGYMSADEEQKRKKKEEERDKRHADAVLSFSLNQQAGFQAAVISFLEKKLAEIDGHIADTCNHLTHLYSEREDIQKDIGLCTANIASCGKKIATLEPDIMACIGGDNGGSCSAPMLSGAAVAKRSYVDAEAGAKMDQMRESGLRENGDSGRMVLAVRDENGKILDYMLVGKDGVEYLSEMSDEDQARIKKSIDNPGDKTIHDFEDMVSIGAKAHGAMDGTGAAFLSETHVALLRERNTLREELDKLRENKTANAEKIKIAETKLAALEAEREKIDSVLTSARNGEIKDEKQLEKALEEKEMGDTFREFKTVMSEKRENLKTWEYSADESGKMRLSAVYNGTSDPIQPLKPPTDPLDTPDPGQNAIEIDPTRRNNHFMPIV